MLRTPGFITGRQRESIQEMLVGKNVEQLARDMKKPEYHSKKTRAQGARSKKKGRPMEGGWIDRADSLCCAGRSSDVNLRKSI